MAQLGFPLDNLNQEGLGQVHHLLQEDLQVQEDLPKVQEDLYLEVLLDLGACPQLGVQDLYLIHHLLKDNHSLKGLITIITELYHEKFHLVKD